MVVISTLKFMRVLVSGWLASGAWSPRGLPTPRTWSHLAWSPCVAMLGRSGRLGLVEVGHSQPLAPRLAALPHAVAMAALRYQRVCTADPSHIVMLSLSMTLRRCVVLPLALS